MTIKHTFSAYLVIYFFPSFEKQAPLFNFRTPFVESLPTPALNRGLSMQFSGDLVIAVF